MSAYQQSSPWVGLLQDMLTRALTSKPAFRRFLLLVIVTAVAVALLLVVVLVCGGPVVGGSLVGLSGLGGVVRGMVRLVRRP